MFPLFRLSLSDLTARPQILEQHFKQENGKTLPQEWTVLSRREQATLVEGWRWGAQPEWIKRRLVDKQLAIREGIHAGTVGGVSHHVAFVLQQDIRSVAARGGGKGARQRRSQRRKLAGVHPMPNTRVNMPTHNSNAKPKGHGDLEQHANARAVRVVSTGHKNPSKAAAEARSDPVSEWQAGRTLIFTRTGFGGGPGPKLGDSWSTEPRPAARIQDYPVRRDRVSVATTDVPTKGPTGRGVGKVYADNTGFARGAFSLATGYQTATLFSHRARMAGVKGLPTRIVNAHQAAQALTASGNRAYATRSRPAGGRDGDIYIYPRGAGPAAGYTVQQFRGGGWHEIANYSRNTGRR